MDKTFTLTISPDYVKNWTEQDAIREFIQNWIDQRNQEPEAGSAIKPKSTLDLLREFLEDELSNLSKRQVEKLNYIINRK